MDYSEVESECKNSKKNIVLIGMPGSGKTTMGESISNSFNMKLYTIDKCIEKQEGKTVSDIFLLGEDYFREIESKFVEHISHEVGVIIDTGGGVIKNPKNIELLKKNGFIIFINRPLQNIIKDIDIKNRPLLKGGIEKLHKLYNERYMLYKDYCDYELMNDRELEVVITNLKAVIEKIYE